MIKTRMEKIIYGDMNTIRRKYIKNGKIIGEILKNPHTDLFEVLRADFINYKYDKKEFDTLKKARNWLGV